MVRGVIAGVGVGGVVAVLGLSVLSLAVPLTPANAPDVPAAAPGASTPAPGLPSPVGSSAASPETAVTLPEGSPFASGAGDRAPAAPGPAPVAPEAAATAPQAPVPAPVPAATPALAGTEPPARPQTTAEAPAAPQPPDTATAALEVQPEAEMPVGVPPPGEAVAPDLPPADAPAAETAAVPEPAPGPEEITLMPDGALVPPGPERPRVFAAGEGESRFAAAEGTTVNRLPQIGAEAPEAPAPEAAASGFKRPPGVGAPETATPEVLAPEAPASRLPQIQPEGGTAAEPAAPAARPALRAFAAPFTATPGLPLYSVVLIDEGTAAGGLDRDTIKALGLPFTIALDPARPDATEAAADYRAAGFEVAMLADALPTGATAQDLEVAFAEWHRRLPEAVALVEPGQPEIQTSSKLVQQAVKALGAEGMGYVTQAQGIASAAQVARAAGLPEASIWRVLDARRDKAALISRTLARAAFEAGRQQGVVVMLSTWPESVAGLQAWAPDAKGKVDLAPLSALLLSRAGGQ